MDKTNNLQHFLTDLADAIREKKGTSDLINAQNFADEIRNMPTSGEGGGESGGGNAGGDTGGSGGVAFYALNIPNLQSLGVLKSYGVILVNCTSPTQTIITTSSVTSDSIGGAFTLNSVCVILDRPFIVTGDQSLQFTREEADNMFAQFGGRIITEEEFYNLES